MSFTEPKPLWYWDVVSNSNPLRPKETPVLTLPFARLIATTEKAWCTGYRLAQRPLTYYYDNYDSQYLMRAKP